MEEEKERREKRGVRIKEDVDPHLSSILAEAIFLIAASKHGEVWCALGSADRGGCDYALVVEKRGEKRVLFVDVKGINSSGLPQWKIERAYGEGYGVDDLEEVAVVRIPTRKVGINGEGFVVEPGELRERAGKVGEILCRILKSRRSRRNDEQE